MSNGHTGFQILAAQGLQAGEGIAPPDITANLTSYNNLPSVSNFSNIYSTANTLPFGLTSANATLLKSIGARSFPHLFGQVPHDFSSKLGTGPLFTIAPARTEAWFGGSPTANVYLQVLGQAQSYAATTQAVLSSAASSQWSGGPSASATGGFSAIGSDNAANFNEVANVLIQLGSLMVPSNLQNGFSNADCFNRILQSGYDQIGNLHLTFYGQEITDPTTGNVWTIGPALFQYIFDNPVGLSDTDTFEIAALNPLDSVLGQTADNALTQTGDLDAVVTFFNVGPNVAPRIYQWTDCLNLPKLFGSHVTSVISDSLDLGTNKLDVYYFLRGLANNIPGLNGISTVSQLGQTMSQIQPLSNLSKVTSLSAPLSQSQFTSFQNTFGPGSGTNGNPTVDDVLGSTNYNQALSQTMQGLSPLTSTNVYGNISTDTNNVAVALTSNVFPVTLSNGNTYADINSLAVGASGLINQNATALASLATSITDTSLFTAYNGIAETHNNSLALTAITGAFPVNVSAIVSNLTSSFPTASGLTGLILSVIHQYFGSSFITKIDNPPQPAQFLKIPGAPSIPSVGALTSFPSSLASMASLANQIPNADEITGMNNISNCFDMASTTGQALQATINEAQNGQILSAAGLPLQSLATNPTGLITPPTGVNTIGGGLRL